MSSKAACYAGTIEHYLEGKPELSHLEVRPRGQVLTLESEDDEGIRYPHARLNRRTIHK